ncbi:A24 family peptidase [Undibacterium sp. TS12]|uniref:prepilin peptidase n=1 Tax=Undibacterium sp. TS12 TaxID=2908202 RepID=UPI0024093C11|nr:A24 family peptidase [Undibacterium sp. TS12]
MMEILVFAAPHDWPSTIAFGLLGLLIGSFLNVVIYRLPKMLIRAWENDYATEHGQEPLHTDTFNLMLPRSACPHCGHKITSMENIPVISYLAIGGKCTGCKAKISIRYPLIEALTGLMSAGMIWHFGSGIAGMAAVVFVWLLIAMTFIDLDTQFLPDDLTLSLLWLGMLVNITATFTPLKDAVIGTVLGYLALWIVDQIFFMVRKVHGFGNGDFKLLAAFGAWMGWTMLPVVIIFSSFVGAAIGIAQILLKRLGWSQPIPFGPYLAGAGLIALLWGKDIVGFYLKTL